MTEFFPDIHVTKKELEDGTMVFSMESSIELDPIDVEFIKLQHYMNYYIRCLSLVRSGNWSEAGITVSPHGKIIHDDQQLLLFGMSRALTFEQFKPLFFGIKVDDIKDYQR